MKNTKRRLVQRGKEKNSAAVVVDGERELSSAVSGSSPTGFTSPEDVKAQWNDYRTKCFFNVAMTSVWIYTAAEEFDCQVAMLHLLEVPGAALDAGSHAISISAFGDFHVIPISRLDSRSISILRPNVEGDIGQRKVELLRDEGCSASSLREKTRQRYAGLLGTVAGQGMH